MPRPAGAGDTVRVRPAAVLRLVVNAVNLSTLLGLLVAFAGRSRVAVAHDGLFLARGYVFGFPPAPAFTLGNVIILRLDDAALARRPRLLVHEARHATQYAWCIGPVMLPLYLGAAGWSWLRARDFSSYNLFERLAGLEDGGYPPPPGRRTSRRVGSP
jgi:hypothetical protein